ncbi:GumC family protein [Algibacillus agarilyticus]|uniref:GumC family protein n=1 Tax=Algibacillus agarilyticus TaxID=2234133 RepID=UPI000DCFA30A|nr:polysaccharide biosynthesis tyrosine autokinase [Algibacillus agarilyticus]
MNQYEGNFKHADDEIDLSELISYLWIKKWFILLITSVVFAAGLVVLQKLPTVYQATTTIMVKSDKGVNPLKSLLPSMGSDNNEMDTIIKLLKSHQFANEIAELIKPPLSYHPNTPSSTWHSGTIQNNLSVNLSKGSNLIELSFQSHDPEFTAIVVNRIVEYFISYQAKMMQPRGEKNSDWLDAKIAEVKANVQIKEDVLNALKNKNGVVDITSFVSQLKREIQLLHNELRTLEKEQDNLSRLNKKVAAAQADPSIIHPNHELAESPLLKKLLQDLAIQKTELSQIKLRYLYKHPKYIETANKISDTEVQITHALNNLALRFKARETELAILISSIKAKQIEINQQLEDAINKDIELKKVVRVLDANTQLLESITSKKTELDLLKDIDHSMGLVVIDPAVIPTHPIKPKKALIAVLSFMLGLMLAIVIVIGWRFISDVHMRYRQIVIHNGYKVIGELPRLKLKRKNKELPILMGSGKYFEIYQECIHAIRTKFALDRTLSNQKLIAISSLMPHEGKSTTCLQLAKSFGELEKVIIIDADLRAPSIAVALGQPKDRIGLTNLMAQTHLFDECKFYDLKLNADVLPSGVKPKNPLLFLSHKRFERLLQVLQTKYDRVILECPPILSVSDALLVSKYVDGLILVTDVTKNSVAKLNHDLQLLKHSDTKIKGIILNQIKNDSSRYYYGSTAGNYSEAKV